MNLSISNIAWAGEYDEEIYAFLRAEGFGGLEIAPTRLFPDRPYDHLKEAGDFARGLKAGYGLTICSMQSIWYGLSQNIFGNNEDRAFLLGYTEKAIQFADAVGCGNLVFGCPKNRNMPPGGFLPDAYAFFKTIGDIAASHGAVVALEANPPIYNTNFINTTRDAFDFCRAVSSEGLKVNIDLGTCIFNGEGIELISDNINLVNHIHISEPYLVPIKERDLHKDLFKLDYSRYMSIEMANPGDIDTVKAAVSYVGGLSGS